MTSYKIKKHFEKFSTIDLDILVTNANSTMFKKSIDERVSNIGDFKYLGFEYTYDKNKQGNVVLFINMYFLATSAPHKLKSGGKKRYKYLLGIKFPYIDGMKTMKKINNVPIKIFSSDPSFNYFFAFALNRINAVILDHPKFIKHLSKSLNVKPKKRNPNLRKELTKHLYKVVKFLLRYSPMEYLDEQYLTNIDKIKIPNKL